MQHIFVLMSFNVAVENGVRYMGEAGKRIWFPTLGKAVSFVEAENDLSDLSEHRWMHLVLEEVAQGPMAETKVLGWWEARYADGRFVQWVRVWDPPIDDAKMYFQFTGIG